VPGKSRGRRWVGVALAVLVVGLLIGAGVVTAGSGVVDAAGRYLPWASPQYGCQTTSVRVVAAPQISDVVRRVTTPLSGHVLEDGSCLRVLVQSEAPVTTVENAASTATYELPQLWIPDSSIWPGQSTAWSTHPVGSLATSPVVLAASPATIQRLGWRGGKVAWPQALDATRHGVVAPGMTNDASSLLGLLALAQTLGPGIKTEQQIVATVLAAARVPAPDLDSALDLVRGSGPASPAVLLTNEQKVTDADRDRPKGVVAVRPTGAPAQLDFPVLRVDVPNEDPVVHVATDVVLGALTGPDARQAARAAGFGPPSAALTRPTAAGDATMAQVAKRSAGFVALVRTLAIPSRLLVAIDTSLSMNQPVRPGLSRVQLAVGGAIAAGELLPLRSAIGLWTFAGRQPGGRPYQTLSKIDALSTVEHIGSGGKEVTHRDVVDANLVSLPRRVSPGGTALYDTALSALRDARRSYDPQATNAVVLFTDGRNDYDGGMSLSSFVTQAKADAAANPRRPVLLIAIGVGPDADMSALRTMCAAAGGRAYQASSAATLQTVLFDAIAHRRVVPSLTR
jgi:Ca-activated chloride channel family protein